MPTRSKNTIEGNRLSVLKNEQSLRSRQYRGLLVRVIYERDFLEIVRTEMAPGSALNNLEFGRFPVVHIIVEGSPLLQATALSNVLVPGDTVTVQESEQYGFYNPTSSRSTILSIVLKTPDQQRIVADRVATVSSTAGTLPATPSGSE